jgi:hypothetical protein
MGAMASKEAADNLAQNRPSGWQSPPRIRTRDGARTGRKHRSFARALNLFCHPRRALRQQGEVPPTHKASAGETLHNWSAVALAKAKRGPRSSSRARSVAPLRHRNIRAGLDRVAVFPK